MHVNQAFESSSWSASSPAETNVRSAYVLLQAITE